MSQQLQLCTVDVLITLTDYLSCQQVDYFKSMLHNSDGQ